jgi:bacteriocin biosynthesis cyclodehydratase domain-containing protein
MTDAPLPRPRLAPGLRVVTRGLDHLQVGLYAGRRVLLPRTEAVERTLTQLLERRVPVEDPESASILDRLDRHGCLEWERPSAGLRIGVLGVDRLLDIDHLVDGSTLRLTSALDDADVVIAAGVGETDRDSLDPFVRSRTSHVVVRLVDGGAVVGPFVVPGSTACLRCIDAHCGVEDPDHVAVTTRYVRATSFPRADGLPDVPEPALATLALSWAVRDVAAYATGSEPSTWSRTFSLGPRPTELREQSWLRHPECGCSWPADLPGREVRSLLSPEDPPFARVAD